MEEYIFFDTESHNPRYMTGASVGGDSMCAFLKLMREDLANGMDNTFGRLQFEASEEVLECFPRMNLGGMKKETIDRFVEHFGKGIGNYIGSLLKHHGNHDRLKYKEMSVDEVDPATYQFKSHGQSIVPFLENFNNNKNSLVLLDEPETALSIRSRHKMVKILEDMASRDCQVLVASHCIELMEAVGEVYSMEHKKWMKSSEFIATQN